MRVAPIRRSVGFAALAAAALVGACARPAPPAAPRPALVESPQLLSDAAAEAYPGAVRAEVEPQLSFRIAGKIARRLVDAGAQVKAGQVLATLDPEDARLNLDAARADYALASAEAQRVRNLKEQGYVSQSQLDNAENRLKLAAAKLALAQNQSSYTQLKADTDGVVTAVLAEAGQTVAAGTPIFRFAAAGRREVLIDVPEGRVDALRQADRLIVTLWTQPGKRYAGKLRVLSPQADPNTRTHEARVSIVDADADVQLGASATVLAGAKSAGRVFRVPASALGDAGKEHPQVWIVKGDPPSAQPVPVQVLQYRNGAAIVSGELHPDDRMITAGVHLLVPGLAVQPVPRSAPAAL